MSCEEGGDEVCMSSRASTRVPPSAYFCTALTSDKPPRFGYMSGKWVNVFSGVFYIFIGVGNQRKTHASKN